MTPVKWTAPAREDLRRIHSHIAKDSSVYASRMIARIKNAVEGVRTLPMAAARVEEWESDEIREIFVATYRVIFQVANDAIEVIAVIHSARDLPDSLRK